MTQLATFDTGDRAYGRADFTRSAYETDPVTLTTATVILVDPDLVEVPVTPVLTNTTTTVRVDWEYTLPADALPGVWYAIVQTGAALVAHDEAPFRVLRSRVDA